jgi:putative transposase
MRAMLNAIRYLVRAGCRWRMLPVHFGPWQTVSWWFRRFAQRLLFQTIHDLALMLDRERQGRVASQSGGVPDSQTVKVPPAPDDGGHDAAKRIKGRKRHVAVDTDGHLLMINLTTADIQDVAGAERIIETVRKRWPWLKHLFAGATYDRDKLMSRDAYRDFVIDIVRQLADQKGFHVLPRRWAIDRTFGWIMRWRRLVRDCERHSDVSEAMIRVSLGALLLRHVAHHTILKLGPRIVSAPDDVPRRFGNAGALDHRLILFGILLSADAGLQIHR